MLRLKKIAAWRRSTRVLWVAWGLVCTSAPHARASDPTVLVLEDAGQRGANAFFPALQIQLADLAEPVRAAAPAANSPGERIERAGELVRANGALAAVWTERSRSTDPVVLYVVGEREGRALVVVVRVPGMRGADLERTLALKAREFVDELRRNRARGIDAALITPGPGPPPPTPVNGELEPAEGSLPLVAASEPTDDAPHWGALALAGAKLGSQPRIGLGRWGFGFGVGPELALARVRFAAVLGVDVFPESQVNSMLGDSARYSELALAGLLRAELRPSRVAFGMQLGIAHVAVHAVGTTRERETGEEEPAVLALAAAWDVALPINETLSAGVSIELQVLADRLKLAVNRADLVDFGHVRARLGVGLVLRPFK